MAESDLILKDLNLNPAGAGQEGAVEKTVAAFEKFYGSIGAINPSQRLFAGFLLASVPMYLAEPGFAFDEQGARPHALFSSDRRATYLHWSTIPIAVGLLSALFI